MCFNNLDFHFDFFPPSCYITDESEIALMASWWICSLPLCDIVRVVVQNRVRSLSIVLLHFIFLWNVLSLIPINLVFWKSLPLAHLIFISLILQNNKDPMIKIHWGTSHLIYCNVSVYCPLFQWGYMLINEVSVYPVWLDLPVRLCWCIWSTLEICWLLICSSSKSSINISMITCYSVSNPTVQYIKHHQNDFITFSMRYQNNAIAKNAIIFRNCWTIFKNCIQ